MQFEWNPQALHTDPLGFLEQQVRAGIYWFDIETDAMSWSEGVYRVLNILPGSVEPSRRAISEQVHPDDRRPLNEVDRLYTSGEPFHNTFRIIMRDRRVRWITNHGEFLMDAAGKPTKVVGVLRDVTEQRYVEGLNREYGIRITAILKLTNAVAFAATASGHLTSISNWQSAFLTDEEPLGLKLIELIHPNDREESKLAWQAAISRGDHYGVEHRMLHSDGTYHWRRCSALPIKAGDGSIQEWIGLTYDVHDEKTGAKMRLSEVPATGAQIRAARSILRMSVRDLHDATGVAIGTIRRIEDIDGISYEDRQTSAILRATMEKRGVMFIFPPGLKPAVGPS